MIWSVKQAARLSYYILTSQRSNKRCIDENKAVNQTQHSARTREYLWKEALNQRRNRWKEALNQMLYPMWLWTKIVQMLLWMFQRSTSQPTWLWTKIIQMLPRTLNQDYPNVAKNFEPRLSKCRQELWTKIIQMLPRTLPRTRTILIDRFHRATAFAIRNMLPARIDTYLNATVAR